MIHAITTDQAQVILDFLQASGDDDGVTAAVERCGTSLTLNYESDSWELWYDDQSGFAALNQRFGGSIDFRPGASWRSSLQDLRRLLNDPRVAAELERGRP